MKKLLPIIIISIFFVMIIITLVYLMENNIIFQSSSKTKIATTLYPIYYLTKRITGDRVNVNLISPATSDPHHFELTPKTLKEIYEADYIFISNTYLDSWIEKLSNNFPKTKVIKVTQNIDLIKINDEIDPHFWHSLRENKKVAREILDNLVRIDINNKEFYESNFQTLIEEMDKIYIESLEELSNLRNKKMITKHNAFGYLARDYNLEIIGYLEKEEGELTPKEISELIRKVKENNIKSVFGENYTDNEKVYNFAKNLNLRVYLLHSLEKSQKDFLEAYRENIEIIKKALSE